MKVSKVHTACHGCKYALWNGDQQYGCDLGVLDPFKSSGGVVIEAENEKEEKFYILNDKHCLLKRNGSYPDDKHPQQDLHLVYHYILRYTSDKETLEVVDNFKAEKFKPHEFTLILAKDVEFESEKAILKALNKLNKFSIKKELIDRPFDDAVHETLLNAKATYYVVNPGGRWPVEHNYFTNDIMSFMIYGPAFTYIEMGEGTYFTKTDFHKILSTNNIPQRLDEIWPGKSRNLSS